MLVRLADQHKHLRDPCKGINDENVVVVRADYFRFKFPQLVIQYYQEHEKIIDDTDEDSDDDVGANPEKKKEDDNGTQENGIEVGNENLSPATVTEDEMIDQGREPTVSVPMIPVDKFGLPVFNECESRRDIAKFVPIEEIFDVDNARSDSSSDSSDEDVEFLKDDEYRKILESESLGWYDGPSLKKADES